MTKRMQHFLITVAIVLGLGLIVGATSNLPASAQGLVTGRNDILINQLSDSVGERTLIAAVAESGELRLRQGPPRNRDGGRNGRPNNRRQENRLQENFRQERDRGGPRINGDIEDQLERIGPERVYKIAVDAGLITQSEATAALRQ